MNKATVFLKECLAELSVFLFVPALIAKQRQRGK